MKRLFLILTLLFCLIAFGVNMASANGGPHGGFTPMTDACAGCHRAHTATNPNLLMVNTDDLCMSCHGATGSGANTNVDDGLYLSSRDDGAGDFDEGAANTPDNAPLLGGGFVNYRGTAVTSAHAIDGTITMAWGNGVDRGELGALTEGMTCASCHDPHGSSNYRIINEAINGVAVTVAQVDEANKDYDTEQWGAGTSAMCAACHGAYHRTAPGQGSILDGTTYTHRVDMPFNIVGSANPETVGSAGYYLPLAEADMVVCMSCHLPHGSAATMTGITDGAGLPGETSATDSALLRLDNRGVCEVCHQK